MAALLPKIRLRVSKKHNLGAVNNAVQVTYYSEKVNIIKNPTTASLKRGTGGRSSFNGIVCTVFGNTGSLGRSLCNQLGKEGAQMICPYRGYFYESKDLKVLGDLGQVLYHPFDLKDEDSIRKCVKYSNVVVNLIGQFWETRNFSYEDVNVEGARRIAKVCKEMGVDRLIHLSCLNVASEPKPLILEKGSKYLKSKYDGENAVREEFPDATIIRPSILYSASSQFLYDYCLSMAFIFVRSKMPLYKKGEKSEKQPVYTGDVAAGIIACMFDRKSIGRTYQFVGDKRYTLKDLVYYMGAQIDVKSVLKNEFKITDFKNNIFDKLKFAIYKPFSRYAYPWGCYDLEGMEFYHTSDNVIENLPGLRDLRIKQTPIESQMPWEIAPYKLDMISRFEYTHEVQLSFPTPVKTFTK